MLSVVIPTWNEQTAIGRTLSNLLSQQGDFEVIVADGGSADATRSVVRSFVNVRLVHAPSGRGPAMNAGASEARGAMLLFLHADTELAPGSVEMLNRIEQEGAIVAGGFRHRFDGRHPLLWIVSVVHNWRARFTRIFYGDQGLFVRKAIFDRLGGFKNEFMEDIEFGERLREACRPVLISSTLRTSARRFEQNGVIRSTCKVLAILAAYNLFHWKLPLRAFADPVREENGPATHNIAIGHTQNSLQGDAR